jgi:putative DNA primase/helicase
LTGGDWIRAEEKGKKAFQYRYDGMVAVLSNIPIFTGDAASRIARRVITIPCNSNVPWGSAVT